MNIEKSKSQFRHVFPMRELLANEMIFLKRLERLIAGETQEEVIAVLPENEGMLFIDAYKIIDITRKHGEIPLENLLITANEPTGYVKGVSGGIPYITLIYEFEGGGFVLSTRKFNGHYVVTFFESLDSKYIESTKRRQ